MMPAIKSLQNQRIKSAIKLRERKGRQAQGRILVDGLREIGHAWEAGLQFLELFTCTPHLHDVNAQALLAKIEQATGGTSRPASALMPLRRFEVTPQVWDKLTFGNRQDGLLAVATPPSVELAELPVRSAPFFVVLDGVEKPGNVGAVIRSADGAGADAVILTNAATDLYNPNTIRASLGTIFHMPVVSTGQDEVLEWFDEHRVARFITAVDDTTTDYTELKFNGPTAIVLGSEAYGVSDGWKTGAYRTMHLPMLGRADSLNVSAAAAAILYEVVRQRKCCGKNYRTPQNG